MQPHFRMKSQKLRKIKSRKNKLYHTKRLTASLKNTNRNFLFICRNKIKLTNNNSTAINPEQNTSYDLALVEGVVLKKGSSIRFKI